MNEYQTFKSNLTTPFQFGVTMSIHDNSIHKSTALNHEDIAMSTDKTPNISPTNDTPNPQSTGEAMQTSDTASDTPHHQYYAYGNR